MTTDDVILLLIGVGGRLIPEADGELGGRSRRLDVDAPSDVLTPELIDELRRHKRELLRRMAAVERLDPECGDLAMLLEDSNLKVMMRMGKEAGSPLPRRLETDLSPCSQTRGTTRS